MCHFFHLNIFFLSAKPIHYLHSDECFPTIVVIVNKPLGISIRMMSPPEYTLSNLILCGGSTSHCQVNRN